MRSKALVAIVMLLLAAGLVACGDGDGGDEASTASTATEATTGSPHDDGGGQANSGGQTDDAEAARGGEASIEEFGSEAGGSERGQILTVFTGYMNAIADKHYDSACADLSAAVQGSLEQLAGEALKAKSCAAILPKLLAPTAAQVARQQANAEVAKVRVEGDRAFVVFKAPGAKLYQLTMVEEGGEWKAATVAAAVLVPEL